MKRLEVEGRTKRAFSLMVGHIPAECLNTTFIMDKVFCLSKGDFKIMREDIQSQMKVTIPFKKFEDASIENIVDAILNKMD